jgi:hypothetical protein
MDKIKLGSVSFDRSAVVKLAQVRSSLVKQAAPNPGAAASAAGKASDAAAKQVVPKSMPQFMKWFGAGLGLAAAGTIVALGQQGVAVGAGKLGDMLHSRKQAGQFNDVLKVDPSLKEEPKAKAFFGVLFRASPYLAGEPELAASAVKSMVNYPEGTDTKVEQLLKAEQLHQGTRHPFLTPRLQVASGALPGPGNFGE